MSLRIIAGRCKGRVLKTPKTGGVRPTPSVVRETLFNWLQGRIEGAQVLDLYAGSGALGIEALSRGAEQVVMVEKSRAHSRLLQENVGLCPAGRGEVVLADGLRYLLSCQQSFDFVFLDPPFGRELLPKTAELLVSKGTVARGGWVFVEKGHEDAGLASGDAVQWHCLRQSRCGMEEYSLWECG